ncbi:hypothetical protein KUTeg_016515 [Tegillarca granosa]|uniref:Uncharacterized protein n=1 Tax=Tegillarca granosa TaxID=220873 RepID=A0ABQ9ERC6_TEGGR|nr:hypothetical protein KUTeg_016515 [Tegillarca granosa]
MCPIFANQNGLNGTHVFILTTWYILFFMFFITNNFQYLPSDMKIQKYICDFCFTCFFINTYIRNLFYFTLFLYFLIFYISFYYPYTVYYQFTLCIY